MKSRPHQQNIPSPFPFSIQLAPPIHFPPPLIPIYTPLNILTTKNHIAPKNLNADNPATDHSTTLR